MNKTILSVGIVAALAGSALADTTIISFTYGNLNSSFDANTNGYTAVATSQTAGDVSRLDGPTGTAEFFAGTLPGVADVQIAMTVSNIGATSADGVGTIVLTDANGDTLSANVAGSFSLLFGSVFYTGALTNAIFTNNSADGTFDGTSTGSFAMPGGVYNGALVELFFNPGNFFASSFSGQTTQVDGILIPAPGSVAMLALGGIVALRRRR